MKTLIAVIFLFYTLYTSGQESRHALSGTWKLIQYKNLKTHKIVKEPPNLKRSVIIKFEDDGFQGHIEGHTSKNPINGGYVVGENHAIHFSGVGIQVYNKEGNEWGDNLSKVFLDVSSYVIEKDTLLINYDNESKAMVFIPTQEETMNENKIYK